MICNKEFKTITKLRVHTKTHVNQCPLCSENFLISQALQDHVKESHGSNQAAVEMQCSLCEFTFNSMSDLAEHNQSVHHSYGCNICISYVFLQSTSWWTTYWQSTKSVLWVPQWRWAIKATSSQDCQNLKMLEPLNRSQSERSATRVTSSRNHQHH